MELIPMPKKKQKVNTFESRLYSIDPPEPWNKSKL